MVDWKITATAIYCDAVDAEVTIMIYKDGTVKCSGYKKYSESITRETARILKTKGKKLGRKLKCEGLDCLRVTGYKDKIFAEEKAKP